MAQEDRQAEGVARAWSILTTPAPGNSGKREALEYLVANDVPLYDIDLSCKTMNGGWDESSLLPNRKCDHPVFLQKIFLEDAIISDSNLSGADINYSEMRDSSFDGSDFIGAKLISTEFYDSDVNSSDFSYALVAGSVFSNVSAVFANFNNAILEESKFHESFLFGADFSNADISQTDFSGTTVSDADFSSAFIAGADFSESRGYVTPKNKPYIYALPEYVERFLPGLGGDKVAPPLGLNRDQYDICMWTLQAFRAMVKNTRNIKPDPCIAPPDETKLPNRFKS